MVRAASVDPDVDIATIGAYANLPNVYRIIVIFDSTCFIRNAISNSYLAQLLFSAGVEASAHQCGQFLWLPDLFGDWKARVLSPGATDTAVRDHVEQNALRLRQNGMFLRLCFV